MFAFPTFSPATAVLCKGVKVSVGLPDWPSRPFPLCPSVHVHGRFHPPGGACVPLSRRAEWLGDFLSLRDCGPAGWPFAHLGWPALKPQCSAQGRLLPVQVASCPVECRPQGLRALCAGRRRACAAQPSGIDSPPSVPLLLFPWFAGHVTSASPLSM